MLDIKAYKFRKLPKSFWTIWRSPSQHKKWTQHVYSLTTSMVMQQWKDDEIAVMLLKFHGMHGHRISPDRMALVITKVRAFTLEQRRRIEREKKARYRAKQKQHFAWLEEQIGEKQ